MPYRSIHRPRIARLSQPVVLAALLIGLALASAQTAAGADAGRSASMLIQRVRAGGYVLVLRHAHAPGQRPSASEADRGNPGLERQLDATGQADARALGAALHVLRVPVGRVYSSPLFRARETVRLAGLPSPQIVPQLTEGPHGMAGSARHAQSAWLQRAVGTAPEPGTDTVIVTHTPNIIGAFGASAQGIQAGEMLVFAPQAGHGRLLGRIDIAQWRGAAERAAAHTHGP